VAKKKEINPSCTFAAEIKIYFPVNLKGGLFVEGYEKQKT
jgi:hypothetical protein